MLIPDVFQTANQAFVLHPGGTFTFEERNTPTIQSDRDVIVRVMATGLCGSDVSEINSKFANARVFRSPIFTPPLLARQDTLKTNKTSPTQVHYWQHGRIGRYVVEEPITLGHESTGIVVERGSGAQCLAIGDRVTLEPGIACNTCNHCRSGHYNLCQAMAFAATPPYDGTLATYYRVPVECCFKLLSHISLRDGTLVEPLSVAVHRKNNNFCANLIFEIAPQRLRL
jgi:L-iditol 2-dehydrogenase